MATGGGSPNHPGAPLIDDDRKVEKTCSESILLHVQDKRFSTAVLLCPKHPDAPLFEDCRAGDQVCLECGLVVGDRTIFVGSEMIPFTEIEERAGDEEELDDKVESELDLIDLNGDLASSFDDSLGVVTKHKQKMSSSEETLFKAADNIHTMADLMHLGRTIVDRANQLFQQVHSGQHLKGHSTDAIAATCLHIGCRLVEVPQSFADVCAVSSIHINEIGNCFKLILEALKITVPPITATDLMPRFCGNLNLGYPIEKLASYIGRKAVELDIVPGRRPASVAATAVFMAAHASDKQFAKNELSNATGVANATIRTVYKLMRPRAAELFPADFSLDLSKLPLT